MCALQEQTKILNSICGLLAKIASDEGFKARGRPATKAMARQLAIAFDRLRDDPAHNISRAADYAFRKSAGYSTRESLIEVLRRKWNSRKP